MNLRLAEGIDLAAYEMRWRSRPDAAKISALVEQDLLAQEGDILRATARGRLLLNAAFCAVKPDSALYDPLFWNVLGAGLGTTLALSGVTSRIARPRSEVPSGAKRKMPSTPARRWGQGGLGKAA